MDTKRDIPHREMGEQDDELLEQLWKQLPDSQENPFISDQGFKDLQGRIQRKLRIKRRFRICVFIICTHNLSPSFVYYNVISGYSCLSSTSHEADYFQYVIFM